MRTRRLLGVLIAAALIGPGVVRAETAPPPADHAAEAHPTFAPIPPECLAPGVDAGSSTNFPNIVKAMTERHKIVVLAIGASAVASGSGRRGDYYGLVEAFLERTFKDIDVEIVQRGVSGELARDAAERIRLEVARVQPDVIFWQVGTADALAGIDPGEIAHTVRDTVVWLRDHRVDTVLIGLHYSKKLAADPQYQAVRAVIADVAKAENVLKISRYEVMETLAKLQQARDLSPTDADLSDSGYDCMAQYLARSLATGLFGRNKPKLPPPVQKP